MKMGQLEFASMHVIVVEIVEVAMGWFGCAKQPKEMVFKISIIFLLLGLLFVTVMDT